MLNVGVPELDGPEESGISPLQNPEEQAPEMGSDPGIETGANADLDDNSDPFQEGVGPAHSGALHAPDEPSPASTSDVSPDHDPAAETSSEAPEPTTDAPFVPGTE